MAVASSVVIASVAAATLLSAGAAVMQAQQAKRVGEYNAKLAENQAIQTEMDSRENMKRAMAEGRRFIAAQRAAVAKAGAELGTGSPLEIEAESAAMLKLQELDAMRNARIQAANLRSSASMSRYQGNAQATAGYISAGATLLSGAGQMAGMKG